MSFQIRQWHPLAPAPQGQVESRGRVIKIGCASRLGPHGQNQQANGDPMWNWFHGADYLQEVQPDVWPPEAAEPGSNCGNSLFS